MATSSQVAGFLVAAVSPQEDKELDRIIHDTIAGVTGLAGAMVRPRWHPEPDQIPEFSVPWCAFGVATVPRDTFAALVQVGETEELRRTQGLEVKCSFYGPTAGALASALADGLQIEQNRALLLAQGISVVSTGDTVVAPALQKNVWVYRTDITINLSRYTVRVYPVHTIVSAELELVTENFSTAIHVSN